MTSPYYLGPNQPLIAVKIDDQTVIMWNWITVKWDRYVHAS